MADKTQLPIAPRCAYCDKPIRIKTFPMAVIAGTTPDKYHYEDPHKTSVFYSQHNGKPVLKVTRRRGGNWADHRKFDGPVETVACWLGGHDSNYGHFCTNNCAADFGLASYKGGFRMVRKDKK